MRQPSPLGEKIEGVPFRVALHRWAVKAAPLGARFILVAIAPGDLEGVRQTRPRLACEREFGKLAAWKRDHNARTVPVLEENDLFLTSWPTRCPRQKPGYRICPTRFFLWARASQLPVGEAPAPRREILLRRWQALR